MDNPFEAIEVRLSNIEHLLLALKHAPKQQAELPDIIGIKEASILLGLTVDTIYGKVHDRTIPFIKQKQTKKLYFSRKKLRTWLEEGEQPTISEIKEQAKKSLQKNN